MTDYQAGSPPKQSIMEGLSTHRNQPDINIIIYYNSEGNISMKVLSRSVTLVLREPMREENQCISARV